MGERTSTCRSSPAAPRFGYNLQINGQQFRNLKLSSASLAGIFTGTITYWDNPLIKADNPGVNFPHIPVHPVGRSDGSGTSYQFSAYLAFMQPAATHAYCGRLGLPATCLPTSQWPNAPGMTLQNGSDGVANYVTASYNNGAIGYAEYAYWVERNAPVASVKNQSGNYVQPTAVNDAVALTKALINPDHTQNLYGVYVNPDPRTYPISSYSYMIVPTNDVRPMDVGKGATLSRFILYFLCQGQQEAQPLGYSPLPPNLVDLGISVNNAIPGGVHAPPATPANCNNPTFHGFLQSHGISGGPTTVGIGGAAGAGGSRGSASGPAARSSSAATGSSASAAGGSAGTSTSVAGHAKTGTAAGSTTRSATSGTTAATGQATALIVTPKNITYSNPFSPSEPPWSLLIVALLAAIFVLPPGLALWRRHRRTSSDRVAGAGLVEAVTPRR